LRLRNGGLNRKPWHSVHPAGRRNRAALRSRRPRRRRSGRDCARERCPSTIARARVRGQVATKERSIFSCFSGKRFRYRATNSRYRSRRARASRRAPRAAPSARSPRSVPSISMLSVSSSSTRDDDAGRRDARRTASSTCPRNCRRGQIDRDAESARQAVFPPSPCGRLLPAPSADRHDQPALFGYRIEFARRHEAAFGIRQRTSASRRSMTAVRAHLRLEIQLELVARERPPQPLSVSTASRPRHHRRRKKR